MMPEPEKDKQILDEHTVSPWALAFLGVLCIVLVFGVLTSERVAPSESSRVSSNDKGQPSVKPGLPNTTDARAPSNLDHIYVRIPSAEHPVPLSRIAESDYPNIWNRIKPIDDATFADGKEADWLLPHDQVISLTVGEQTYAFPLRLMDVRQVTNMTIDGIPLLITYCPLLDCATVHDRRVDGQVLQFDNTTGLYDSDLVLVDEQTGSLWWQAAGVALHGELEGKQLTLLPSFVTTWKHLLQTQPEAIVMLPDAYDQQINSLARNVNSDSTAAFLNARRPIVPVSARAQNDALKPGQRVLVVSFENQKAIYPLDQAEPSAVRDEIAGQNVLILIDPKHRTAGAFALTDDDPSIEFAVTEGKLIDVETNSTWSALGVAIDGPRKGQSLKPIPMMHCFWMAAASLDANSHTWIREVK